MDWLQSTHLFFSSCATKPSKLRRIGTLAHQSVSDEALSHLKSYKYSSVDQSPLSNYVLRHYVRSSAARSTAN